MKFVTSLSVKNLRGQSTPLWPPGVRRLIAITLDPDLGDDKLVVYCVDPDKNAHVFQAIIESTHLSALLRAVIDGIPLSAIIGQPNQYLLPVVPVSAQDPSTDPVDEPASEPAEPGEEHVVILPNPDPKDPGPKALALATAIDAVEQLAIHAGLDIDLESNIAA